jgi:tetratricopeptide (TPR) repeat protein
MMSEYYGLKANFYLRFLKMEKAEEYMRKYKNMEDKIRQMSPSLIRLSYWQIFRHWAQSLHLICSSTDSPFFENEEILQKILTNLNLCLQYNNDYLGPGISKMYAEVYLMLNQTEKVQFYLDQAFKDDCTQYSHCSVPVRECYELYERFYKKTGEHQKRMKCLTKIWQITSNLSDKCSCYLKSVEAKMDSMDVEGKWRGGKQFLKRCCYKFCSKIESKPREFQKCSRCSVVVYCSRKCQKKSWRLDHKKNCKPCGHV